MTRAQVIDHLVAVGTRRDIAVQYADVFLEYREASLNIEQHGAIVLDPRTAMVIANPYLVVRDRALKKLQSMRAVNAAGLW